MRGVGFRLAALYLDEEDIEMDRIYHDEIYLEATNRRAVDVAMESGDPSTLSAQGDRPWWNDHRIPGGMAFSTNSVGHLAKSSKLDALMAELEKELGISPEEGSGVRIDSLEKALQFAMQTIANASNAVSGPATGLLPLPADPSELPVRQCPIKLPASLANKNHCRYRGFYHTDYTLPSDYFRDCVERPPENRPFDDLDFTYLFHRDANNPAYSTMGSGVPIRAPGDDEQVGIRGEDKDSRSFGEEIPIEKAPRLIRALPQVGL